MIVGIYMLCGVTISVCALLYTTALRRQPVQGEVHDGVKMVGALLTTWFILLTGALVMTGWAAHDDKSHLLPFATYVASTVFGAVFATWPSVIGLTVTRAHVAAMVLFGGLIGWAVGTAWLLRSTR